MRTPAVSVVIPLYNKEKFIARALESVFVQTFEDYEVIVVDDGSADQSMDVVARFSDPRLRSVTQANAGPGAARNSGAKAAVSDLVAFLDADDELLPDFLSKSVTSLKLNPDCAMSVCAFVRGPEKQTCSGIDGHNLKPGAWRMPAEFSPIQLRAVCSSMHAYGVIRKPEFLRLGGYYENGCLLGEDTYLLVDLLLNDRLYLEAEALMWYHSENAELCLHYVHEGAANWHALRKTRPMVPLLVDQERVRANCPLTHRPLLEQYLAYEALSEAQTRSSIGDFATARELRQRFPLMASFKYEYAKLQLKLALPAMTQWMSRMKSATC